MIKKVQLGKEIVVTVVNKIGVLADMSRVLSKHGANIEAVAGYAVNNEAKIMLVTDGNLRAIEALKKSGYKSITERETIILDLENKPGALKLITEKLASESIDIKQIYGTTCQGGMPGEDRG
jgi:hypothetical protein